MPSSTTSRSKVYYCIYVLESMKDNKRYIGFTINLKQRIRQHQEGESFSTRYRRPFKLIYAELCTNKEDAVRREKYLKETGGRRFLAKRLKSYYKQ